ncbi:glutathione S-transferase [Atractiella rhizophila]|nr:glutathione S-transferase [Atractiella rhizophila]
MSEKKDITSWASNDGQFRRAPSSFRNAIEKDGEFSPEKGRYWLYVSYACPWAHRTLIVRALKGLTSFIGVTVVHPHMGSLGWSFGPDAATNPSFKADDVDGEPKYGFKHLRELYFKSEPNYEGRFTVPVLWDLKSQKIVNNESSEIIRMFNTAFDDLIEEKYKGVTFYPEDLRGEIDGLNEWVYDTINNGVYKCGFASTQAAYESNVIPLFESLNKVEKILEGKDYLVGNKLTEADIRLFTTIVRFDPVYVGHFKCNIGTIRGNFPNIHRWLRQLYWKDAAFKSTTNFQHIKQHYYWSHTQINPTRIVPHGPEPEILPL